MKSGWSPSDDFFYSLKWNILRQKRAQTNIWMNSRDSQPEQLYSYMGMCNGNKDYNEERKQARRRIA